MQKIKNLFRSSESRNGSLQCGNHGFGHCDHRDRQSDRRTDPEKYKNLDVSSTKIYEISKTRKSCLRTWITK